MSTTKEYLDRLSIIDNQIISRLVFALYDRDKEAASSAIEYYQMRINRINGVCLCHAHSSNECICGAWDDD